jgi:hypothetical protein
MKAGDASMMRTLSLPFFLVLATMSGTSTAATTRAESVREINAQRSSLLREGAVDVAIAKEMGQNPDPAPPSNHAHRAYPPSCLGAPLPDQSSGPVYSTHVNLYNPDAQGGVEDVTATIWRIACSSSGQHQPYNSDGLQNAVTLLRLDRGPGRDGDTTSFPDFPDVRVAQGGIAFDDPGQRDFVRLATDPNTFVADTSVASPLPYSTTFVLENYPFRGAAQFNFNFGFELRIDPGLGAGEIRSIRVPAYSPGTRSYPAAFQPLPITGYLTSNWYDPAHSGEGMVVQVFESPGAGGANRQLAFDWFTFDAAGRPFWIAGNAAVRSDAPAYITVPAFYFGNGGFAGNFGARADALSWGEVRLEFADCNRLTVYYSGNQGLPAGVPGGSGTLHYQRLGNVNGLACE